MGPACGLTSGVRVVEEEDATALVDAITDSSGRSGKERIVGKVGLIKAACTWQGSEEGRQHQVEGKEDKESEGNQRLVTIIGTYYCSCQLDDDGA
jgi:hypothetical protein